MGTVRPPDGSSQRERAEALKELLAERVLVASAAKTEIIPVAAGDHPRLRGASALVGASVFAGASVA